MCFVGGTQIATPEGRKSIGNIMKGDMVLAYDHKEDKVVETEVIDIKSYLSKELYVLTTIDGKQIKGTKGHRFFVLGSAYLEIESIKPGQQVMTKDMEFIEVKTIEKLDSKETTVYDMSTAFGTYYVGDDKILVRSGKNITNAN